MTKQHLSLGRKKKHIYNKKKESQLSVFPVCSTCLARAQFAVKGSPLDNLRNVKSTFNPFISSFLLPSDSLIHNIHYINNNYYTTQKYTE